VQSSLDARAVVTAELADAFGYERYVRFADRVVVDAFDAVEVSDFGGASVIQHDFDHAIDVGALSDMALYYGRQNLQEIFEFVAVSFHALSVLILTLFGSLMTPDGLHTIRRGLTGLCFGESVSSCPRSGIGPRPAREFLIPWTYSQETFEKTCLLLRDTLEYAYAIG
jgi:hypothetical protein